MDLSTTYLGMNLPHPLMAGSSPLSGDLDAVKELEDAGAAALVLPSLFEEQIVADAIADELYHDGVDDSSAEAATYQPGDDHLLFGSDEYLEHLRRVKAAVRIPVIASLNADTSLGWVSYSRLMEREGADALELNVLPTALDWRRSSAEIEAETLAVVGEVKRAVRIPVSVKLPPFLTSFAHFAVELDRTGADGLVLFNRLYDADIDVEELEVRRWLHLSNSQELSLRLRGVAAIAPFVRPSLAISGGVHTALDVVKSTMVGAHGIQMVSALLQNGTGHLRTVLGGVEEWMGEHGWESLAEMRGNMAVDKIPDPQAYIRSNYRRLLESWPEASRLD